METEYSGKTGANIYGKGIGGCFYHPQKPEADDQIQGENDKPADKTKKKKKNRENKIGTLFWEETVMALGSLQIPLPRKTARTYGDNRLDDIPAGTPGVYVGIKKHNEPHYLVTFQKPAGDE
jgi:hypothetical protein